MLFDLTTDPGESTDRSADEPERVAALRATLAEVLGERTKVASAPQER